MRFDLSHRSRPPRRRQRHGHYTERYVYDAVGNILEMQHRGSDPAHPGWTRTYAYDEASLIEPPARQSNRLSSTTDRRQRHRSPTTYDAHGNMTRMPHLHADAVGLRGPTAGDLAPGASDRLGGTAETTYYVYDAAGQRVRKVTERQNGTRQGEERIYLGGFEIYREYDGDGTTVTLERETLHVMDDKQRIALVETRTQGDDGSRRRNSSATSSATTSARPAWSWTTQAQIISYEEYTPTAARRIRRCAARASRRREAVSVHRQGAG